jgi:hypothetical protein
VAVSFVTGRGAAVVDGDALADVLGGVDEAVT